MFVLPDSDTYVFGSLYGSYWLGKYDSVAKGAATPTFAGPTINSRSSSSSSNHATENATNAKNDENNDAANVPLASKQNGTFSGLGIWKTGGSGPNNVANASSRRLFFGTIGMCGGNPYPSIDPMVTSLHVGSVAALPRDLSLRKDGSGGLGMAFVPELATLRRNGTHVSATNVHAGARTNFTSQHAEIKVTFPPFVRQLAQ